MSGANWRLAARLARREVRRRPGRSALVTSLVALPVAGMLVAVAYQRANELSAGESWRLNQGRADAVVHGEPHLPPATDLPEGGRAVDIVSVFRVAVADTGLCRCLITSMPFEPLTDGMVQVTAGRAPRSADEVLLSPASASAMDVGRGDRLELTRPVAVEATVVGIGLAGSWTDHPLVALGPGVNLPADGSTAWQRLVDLPDGMDAEEVAAWEATAGPHSMAPWYPDAVSPWFGNTGNQNTEVRWTWVIGAVGLTVLGIVIAAAFAASARRQLATLGQLAANGATPAGLRRVLFLQGTVTGLIGAAAGLVLGAGVLVALRPRLGSLVDHAVPGWEVRLLDVLPIVAMAVVAATVAAMVPAFGASRVSALTALAGRRPLGRVSRRHTVAGLVTAAAGLGCLGAVAWAGRDGLSDGATSPLSLVALAGPVLLLVGVCAAAPAYVTVLRPVASGTRGSWRLAARSLFRQRTRTSALVAAIAALSALAVATAGVGLMFERDARQDDQLWELRSDVVLVETGSFMGEMYDEVPSPRLAEAAAARIERLVPSAERSTVSEVVLPGSTLLPSSTVWGAGGGGGAMPRAILVADEQLRQAFELDDVAERALRREGAVWTGEPDDGAQGGAPVAEGGAGTPGGPIRPDRVRVEAVTYAPSSDPAGLDPYASPTVVSTTRFEAVALGPEHSLRYGAGGELVVTPERAEELGFDVVATGVALRSPKTLTGEQLDDLRNLALSYEAEDEAAAATGRGTGGRPDVRIEFHQPGFYAGATVLEAVPATVALLLTLFVVAAGLALAAAETRDERATLAVLGASPRTVRRTSAYKAFLLTLLGGVLAVPLGLVPLEVYTRLSSDPVAVPFPWRTAIALVVAVPLVTAVAAALATRAGARRGRTAPVGGGAVV